MQAMTMNEEGRRVLGAYGLDEAMLRGCRVEQYEDGEFLFVQGTPLDAIRIVFDGTAKLSIQTQSGKSLILCYYISDGILGDMELMKGGAVATTTVIAASRLWCVAIPLEANEAYLRSSVPFLNCVGRELSEKLMKSSDAHTASALYSSEARLCAYLLMIAQQDALRENLTDVAQAVGISYRHVFRIMHKLCDDGALERTDAGYRIADRQLLQRRAYAEPSRWKRT